VGSTEVGKFIGWRVWRCCSTVWEYWERGNVDDSRRCLIGRRTRRSLVIVLSRDPTATVVIIRLLLSHLICRYLLLLKFLSPKSLAEHCMFFTEMYILFNCCCKQDVTAEGRNDTANRLTQFQPENGHCVVWVSWICMFSTKLSQFWSGKFL